jgi:hypothetical protein
MLAANPSDYPQSPGEQQQLWDVLASASVASIFVTGALSAG